MRTGQPTPTSGREESTVQIDVEEMKIGDVSLRVYDCAGQVGKIFFRLETASCDQSADMSSESVAVATLLCAPRVDTRSCSIRKAGSGRCVA